MFAQRTGPYADSSFYIMKFDHSTQILIFVPVLVLDIRYYSFVDFEKLAQGDENFTHLPLFHVCLINDL